MSRAQVCGGPPLHAHMTMPGQPMFTPACIADRLVSTLKQGSALLASRTATPPAPRLYPLTANGDHAHTQPVCQADTRRRIHAWPQTP